ncbi:MAG: hypothetical protein ACR2NP_02165 [Pirellulaceae bacterium]
MTSLKGVLYPSGNIDFPRDLNEWAFGRMQNLRSDQEKRIVMHPEVAPIELSRSPELQEEANWLESMQEIVNACTTVNLARRESALRLRQAVCDINDDLKLVTLATQEAIDEFANAHWKRIAYFYATRHDGFRFDLGTMISMKQGEPGREEQMELVTRIVEQPESRVPSLTFDATGSHANVNIVDWRKSVAEGDSGRFKLDDTEVHISVPQARMPMTFLYEHRREFNNHAYIFSGEKLERELRRAFRRATKAAERRAQEEEEKAAAEATSEETAAENSTDGTDQVEQG